LQKETDIKRLKVMSASAGSGKTYQLVLEYLEILLDYQKDSAKFKHIVAMTFTNKAAFEMKDRVLKTLFSLATHDGTNGKTAEIVTKLSERLQVDGVMLQKRAQNTLTEILHSYEDFQISTIDKFNLRLIRSFNRDLNLPQEFEVIMNENEILERVIDSIFGKIGKPGQENLTKLIENYTRKNLDDGAKWNFRDKLIDFSSILGKERYIPMVAKLLKQTYNESDLTEAKQRQKNFIQQVKVMADRLVSNYLELNIDVEKIPNKSKTHNAIIETAGVEEFKLDRIAKPLFSAKFMEYLDAGFKGVFPPDFCDSLYEIQAYYASGHIEYIKLQYYTDTFYNLALLQYVAKEMEVVRNDEQFIRISEFNTLISKLVWDQVVPYIYEKLGNRLHHFLLDEFQDTSKMQWLNLIPLLEESLSKGHKNLIVGDSKQSIYRFNNGLAQQFVELPRIYNPDNDPEIARKSAYFETMGEVINLEENFRSAHEIVHFNNEIFKAFLPRIPLDSVNFYNSIHQNTVKKFKGVVSIKSELGEDSEIDVYTEIQEIIDRCVSDGFKLGDICILSEKNVQGNEIAQFLTSLNYKVVSSDSLLIYYDARIRLCLSYLRRRKKPSNLTEAKRFAELYLRLNHEDAVLKYMALFKPISPQEPDKRFFDDQDFICSYFNAPDQFFYKYDNLYDLIEKFYAMMNWKETEDVYLHHFADVCFNYQNGKKVDVESFLDYFEENKFKIAIQLPKTDDAIQIMTIHKSKGLEFPVVIIPNLNFTTAKSKGFYLIDDVDQVYYRMLKKDSPIPRIREYTAMEMNQIFMDKLNLLYVALTRPTHRLYGFNLFEKDQLGNTLHDALLGLYPSHLDGELLHVKIGEEAAVERAVETTDVFYHAEEFGNRLWYPDLVVAGNFSNDEIGFGKGFHALAAACDDANQLSETLDELIEASIVEMNDRDALLACGTKMFAHGPYKSWIQESINIRSENWIIDTTGNLARPDKIIELADAMVLIDFKTGEPKPNHTTQIKAYSDLLSKMTTKEIKPYLYYTRLDAWLAC